MLQATSGDGELGIFQHVKRSELVKREITLTAKPRLSLKVIVKDLNHNPLSGAEVFLGAEYGSSSSYGKRFRTDANGKAIITDVYECGLYSPRVTLQGFYYDNMTIRLLPSAGSEEWKDQVELYMEPANRTQRGKVLDPSGKPVEGVEVVTDTMPETRAITNASGEFTFENLPYSGVRLRVQKAGMFAMTPVDKYSGDVVIKLRKTGP